ncbi:E3 ubiquitin-protein ligase MARCH7-like [Arapaima gigas]
MESRSYRLPFLSSRSSPLSSSASAPLSTSRLCSRSHGVVSDGYSRGTSSKVDSALQSPRIRSSRNYGISEGRHSSWRLGTPLTSSSRSYDSSWTESSLGSRSKLGSSERLGTYSGLLCSTQDDFKRPKLSSNQSTYLRDPSSPVTSSMLSSTYSSSEPQWKSHGSRSRSSSSSPSQGLWPRRESDPRAESSLSSLEDPRPRAAGLSSSLYPDRVMSSYAQGARPKESFYSSSQDRPQNRYEPHPLSSNRTRSSTPWAGPSCSRSWYSSSAEQSPPAPRTRTAERGDPEGRCTTRQLLSRLASSMFSRRSSQDSNSSRSFESLEEASDAHQADSPIGSSSNRNGNPDGPGGQGSELSPGSVFLRRRRQSGTSRQEHGTEAEPEPSRAGASRLSSSLRSRCTPLFSCRRRDGQEVTHQLPHSNTSYPLHADSSEKKGSDDEGGQNEGDDDEAELEAVGAVGPSGAAEASRSGRTRRLTGITPNSLFHLTVTPSLQSSLPENVMITVDIMSAGRNVPEKGKQPSSRDPEKLKKIKESLLLEESDEEGDLCRICQMVEESASNPLIEPCRCTGSLQYVHQDCMKKWLHSKITSGNFSVILTTYAPGHLYLQIPKPICSSCTGSDLDAITTCELCKEKLRLNIENFDINELYRTHEQSEREFISCGLYLVVLLHLCEQRFSDVLGAANDAGVREPCGHCYVQMFVLKCSSFSPVLPQFFNLARTLHEYMDDLESSNGDSEDESQEHRPSIDFGDLEDDDEETLY